VTLRLIVRASGDGGQNGHVGHQTPILTSRTDLTAGELAWRMSARWRQENYFKYAREHFALDALDSHADTAADLTRPVPNPAKTDALNGVATARASLTAAQAGMTAAIEQAGQRARHSGSAGKATVDPSAARALAEAEQALQQAQDAPARPSATCRSDRSGPTPERWKPNASSSPTPSGSAPTTPKAPWPACSVPTTPAATTKPARCCAKRSPCPATCRSPAAPCTCGSTQPAHPAAAAPSPPSAPSSPPPTPATPAPTSSSPSASKAKTPLHDRSPHVRSSGLGADVLAPA